MPRKLWRNGTRLRSRDKRGQQHNPFIQIQLVWRDGAFPSLKFSPPRPRCAVHAQRPHTLPYLCRHASPYRVGWLLGHHRLLAVRFVEGHDKLLAALLTLQGRVQNHVSRPVLSGLVIAVRALNQVFNETQMDVSGMISFLLP
jgi:hypothetical protein